MGREEAPDLGAEERGAYGALCLGQAPWSGPTRDARRDVGTPGGLGPSSLL